MEVQTNDLVLAAIHVDCVAWSILVERHGHTAQHRFLDFVLGNQSRRV
jgi:hypothetical protein